MKINKEYWSQRYREEQTGWDIGEVSSPLKEYIDQLKNKSLRILIPGAGNAWEAEYLFKKGFKNVHVLDFAEEPLENLKTRNPAFPNENLIRKNFFELEEDFDLILEQTFFCSLPVEKREFYAEKMFHLLRKGGKLVGLFFNREFDHQGPPFGGSKEEYLRYFSPRFKIEVFEPCYNSILPRKGSELFFIFKKINE